MVTLVLLHFEARTVRAFQDLVPLPSYEDRSATRCGPGAMILIPDGPSCTPLITADNPGLGLDSVTPLFWPAARRTYSPPGAFGRHAVLCPRSGACAAACVGGSRRAVVGQSSAAIKG